MEKPDLVNEKRLKATGAVGVIKKGEGVQVIYGPNVTVIKANLEQYLLTAPDEEPEVLPEAEDSEPQEEKKGPWEPGRKPVLRTPAVLSF